MLQGDWCKCCRVTHVNVAGWLGPGLQHRWWQRQPPHWRWPQHLHHQNYPRGSCCQGRSAQVRTICYSLLCPPPPHPPTPPTLFPRLPVSPGCLTVRLDHSRVVLINPLCRVQPSYLGVDLQWGTTYAEIKVPSVENARLTLYNVLPLKSWNRLGYSHSFFAYCQEFSSLS